MHRHVETLIGTILIALGITIAIRGFWTARSAHAARGWPRTTGVVTSCRRKECRDAEGRRTFKEVISYRFDVDGDEVIGRRACFGDCWATNVGFFVQRVMSRYPAGSEVSVRYNPANPRDAVLEPGMNPLLVQNILIGVLLVALGVVAIRMGMH